MIRHGGRGTALTVLALAIPMIQSSLPALLMATIGGAPLLTPGLGTARVTTIALAAETVRANEKHPTAGRPATKSLSKGRL